MHSDDTVGRDAPAQPEVGLCRQGLIAVTQGLNLQHEVYRFAS